MKSVWKEAALFTRAVPAVAIGGLVLVEILRRSGGKRTPQQYGGWQQLDPAEFQEPVIDEATETLAPVIPLREVDVMLADKAEAEIPQKVIGEDIPISTASNR